MNITVKDVLEQILLPVSSGWKLENVNVDEQKKEIQVYLNYHQEDVVTKAGTYPVHDRRAERTWRHLDLWEYKTVIKTRIPRYKNLEGQIKSIEVPWAAAQERISYLLEKKR